MQTKSKFHFEMYVTDEVTITRLLEAAAILEALEEGGVDNWSWYGESIKDYCERQGVKDINELVEQQKADWEIL